MKRHQHRKRYLSKLMEEIHIGLGRRSLRAWEDRLEIEPSEDFQPRIALGLAASAGAIVLVDQDALSSSFMQTEVVSLSWRTSWEAGFQVIPVLLEGVSTADFERSPLGATGNFATRCSALDLEGTFNALTAPEHAALIVDTVQVSHDPDPVTEDWLTDMSIWLNYLPREILDRAARALGFAQDDRWRAQSQKAKFIAAALLHASISEGFRAFNVVKPHLPPTAMREVGQRIIPLWVSLSVAREVVDLTRLRNRPTVGVATETLEHAEHAILRGTAHRANVELARMHAPAAENAKDELIAEFDSILRVNLALEAEDEPEFVGQSLEEADQVVFALVDCVEVPMVTLTAVVRELGRRFPGVVFVLVAPSRSRAFKAMRGPKYVLTEDSGKHRGGLRLARLIKREINREHGST